MKGVSKDLSYKIDLNDFEEEDSTLQHNNQSSILKNNYSQNQVP